MKRAAILSAVLLTAAVSYAADHIDSPATVAEPTADITDLYAWMTPDAQKLNIIMNSSQPIAAVTRFKRQS